MHRSLLLTLALAACAPTGTGSNTQPSPSAPPDQLLGDFIDDYGNEFQISSTEWVQLPHGRFHIVEWHPAEQFLIARNDSSNRSAPGRWTRIDWMDFTGMAPYRWGFCLSAYDAPTRQAAIEKVVARRETPRVGCNGFPFSRMKPKT